MKLDVRVDAYTDLVLRSLRQPNFKRNYSSFSATLTLRDSG